MVTNNYIHCIWNDNDNYSKEFELIILVRNKIMRRFFLLLLWLYPSERCYWWQWFYSHKLTWVQCWDDITICIYYILACVRVKNKEKTKFIDTCTKQYVDISLLEPTNKLLYISAVKVQSIWWILIRTPRLCDTAIETGTLR